MTFNQNVWNICKRIPKGKVSTYGEIARALNTKAYRAVGNALNKNPYGAWGRVGGKETRSVSSLVPCHRVVKSDGSLGGFAHGSSKKQEMLEEEGVSIVAGKVVEFEEKLFLLPPKE
jgi:methylated-DNA-[protein]-cysteine S-methyltransferase